MVSIQNKSILISIPCDDPQDHLKELRAAITKGIQEATSRPGEALSEDTSAAVHYLTALLGELCESKV